MTLFPSPRDAVLLKTVYKSPTTAHIFSFSADEPNVFPHIPPVEANTIRTQVDLLGFTIEALSPTTTLLTLLEQSDPKGWTNKTSIPQLMITTLAGIGEFAIKCGGPPIVTRLAGAKATEIRYDHERALFRIEYEVSASRRTLTSPEISPTNSRSDDGSSSSSMPATVECELRCDMDTWAASFDIVVDPPPQSVSCLRRHRLSSGGGGLWLTLTHDAVLAGEERLMAIVRRGPGRERGVVMVNGSKVAVDVEDLPESEIKSLSKQKRVKPRRIPLDQPPVLGVIRRRQGNSNNGNVDSEESPPPSPTTTTTTTTKAEGTGTGTPAAAAAEGKSSNSMWSSAVPRFRSPLGRYLMQAMESTQQAVAAIAPPSSSGAGAGAGSNDAAAAAYSTSNVPMEYALNALQYLQALHSRSSTGTSTGPTSTSATTVSISVSADSGGSGGGAGGWALISEKGFPLHRKLAPEISATLPVYKGERVIEGISAEEIAAVVTSYDARRRWDERFVGAQVLEAFAAAGAAHTAFAVSKASFPFRDRGFYLASILARGSREGGSGSSNNSSNINSGGSGITGGSKEGGGGTSSSSSSSPDGRSPPLFCVSASFPAELAPTTTSKNYNPYNLPIGQMFIDGWILETLDPYTTENYAIPSTRCTRVVAADYAGSLPAAVNAVTNTTLVKTLLSVEAYIKGVVASSLPFARLPAAGVLLVDKRTEDEQEQQHHHLHPRQTGPSTSTSRSTWTLRRRDENRVLVQTRWMPDERVYRGIMLLTVPAEPVPAATAAAPVSPNSTSTPNNLDQTSQTKVMAPGTGAGGIAPPPLPASSSSPSSSESIGSILTVRPHSRSVSSSSGTLHSMRPRRVTSAAVAVGGRSPSTERALRATSSAFTVRGEVRQAADLLVAEFVVDSKLYPEGYQVHLRSRPHDPNQPISLLSTTVTAATGDGAATATATAIATGGSERTEPRFLPLTHSVHTLPSSPLHSSGLAVDQPPRQLLRLMLPTAQTQISTLLDPLTGETRAPPPKPQWMLDLCEKGAVIEVEIRPATQSVAVKTRGITIDGVAVEVEGEKESLTSLGREELQDDRVAWMAVLSRCVSRMRGRHVYF